MNDDDITTLRRIVAALPDGRPDTPTELRKTRAQRVFNELEHAWRNVKRWDEKLAEILDPE